MFLVKLVQLTSGSDSIELGGVSLWGRSSPAWLGLAGPVLGGGRWKSLAWSCWADGQGRESRTHSTGSSHTAFWPCACARRMLGLHMYIMIQVQKKCSRADPDCHFESLKKHWTTRNVRFQIYHTFIIPYVVLKFVSFDVMSVCAQYPPLCQFLAAHNVYSFLLFSLVQSTCMILHRLLTVFNVYTLLFLYLLIVVGVCNCTVVQEFHCI